MNNIETLVEKLLYNPNQDPYTLMGVVRKRYILNEVIINNTNENVGGNAISDNDKINLDKVIDVYNRSNSGYESRTINNGTVIVNNGVVYEPNTIDKATYVKTSIGGKQGYYDGGKRYTYGFDNILGTTGLYSTRINITKNIGYLDLTPEEKARVEELLQRRNDMATLQNATTRDQVNGVKGSYIKDYDELIKIYTDHLIKYNIPATDRYNTLVTKRSLAEFGFTSLVYVSTEGQFFDVSASLFNIVTGVIVASSENILTRDEAKIKEACIRRNDPIYDAYDTASKDVLTELHRIHKEELAKPVGAGTQDNYMTNVIASHLRQIKQLYPLMSQKAIDVINSDVLSYCYAIEAIHKMMIDNINTLEFNIIVGGTSTEVSLSNSYRVDLTFERSRFLDFLKLSLNNININYTKYFEGFVRNDNKDVITINKIVKTSELFKESSLTVELLSDTFDISNPIFSNFVFNVKTVPSPQGLKNVKIPQEGSQVFISKTGNESFFCVQATKYDGVDVKISDGGKLFIKEYLATLKTDKLYLHVGKRFIDEERGMYVEFNMLDTRNVNVITLETGAGKVRLSDNYIDINTNGSNLIGIGRKGESTFTTPYDNNITNFTLLLDDAFYALNKLYECFLFDESSIFSYTTYVNGRIEVKDVASIVGFYINRDMTNDGVLNERYLASYDASFSTVWRDVKALKKELRAESERVRRQGTTIYDALNFQTVDTPYQALRTSVGNDIISDMFLQSTLLRHIPINRQTRRRNDGFNFYLYFMYHMVNSNSRLLPEIEELILKTNWDYGQPDVLDSTVIRTENRVYNLNTTYLSPEDATNIVSNYLITKYVILKTIVASLIQQRDEYILKQEKSEYSESLGLIINDLMNGVIGGLQSYFYDPSTQTNKLQTTGAEQSFDANVEILKAKNNNLNK